MGRSRILSTRTTEPYFEQAEHRAEVLNCVRQGILPLKYAYTGSAAHTHDRLARSDGYQHVIGSVQDEVVALLRARLPAAAIESFAEIGPGNGDHTVALLGALNDHGIRCARYLAMDFSGTLVNIARRRIEESTDGSMEVDTGQWDIELGPSRHIGSWRHDGPILVGLLGHTLGNLENVDSALRHIADSVEVGDVMITTLTLTGRATQPEALLRPYRTVEFRAAVLEPLRAIGLDGDDIEFDLHYDNGVVVADAILTLAVRVNGVELPSGHNIRCFRSRRFTTGEVSRTFAGTGWSVDTMTADDRAEHLVVTASRKDG